MTDYITNDTDLTSVANAIRVKAEISGSLEFPSEFISAINSITGGGMTVTRTQDASGGEVLTITGEATEVEPLSVTANGTYTAPSGKAYSPVTVNVPQGITPTGTINITQNGTVDVTNYASANVNVSGGGGGNIITFTLSGFSGVEMVSYVDENGTYHDVPPEPDPFTGTVSLTGTALENSMVCIRSELALNVSSPNATLLKTVTVSGSRVNPRYFGFYKIISSN